MRHAVVVAPPHFAMPAEGSVFAAPEPVGPMCAVLTRGGRRVMLVQATPELAQDFERAVSDVGQSDDLVVYMAAATTTRTDSAKLLVARGGASLGGHPVDANASSSWRPSSAPEIDMQCIAGAIAKRRPAGVLYLIEAYHDGDGDDPLFAAEQVDVILRTLEVRAHGHGVAIGVRSESTPRTGNWPFTGYLLAALQDPASRNERGVVRTSALYERLRAGGALETHVQSFTFVRSNVEFDVVEPVEATARAPNGGWPVDEPRETPAPEVPVREAEPAPSPEPPAEVSAVRVADLSSSRDAHVDVPVVVADPPSSRDAHVEIPVVVADPPSSRDAHVEIPASVADLPSSRDAHVEVPVSVADLPPSRDAQVDVPISVADLPSSGDGHEEDSASPMSADASLEIAIGGAVDTPRVPSDVSLGAFARIPPSFPRLPQSDAGELAPPSSGVDTEASATSVSLPSPAPFEATPGDPRPTEPTLPGATSPLPDPITERIDFLRPKSDDGIPPPRATEPSLPAIEPLLDLADDALERGALPAALAGYKAALMVAPPADAIGRAAIYARIGELKRAQGKIREAELNFEKAVHADPMQKGALNALVELATGSKELRRAVDLRTRRLRSLTSPDERVEELRAIAEIYATELADPRAAADALDQALSVEGKSRPALQGLRTAYEKLRRWPRVAEVLYALAETAEGAKEKASLHCAAGEVVLERLRDEERGLGLLERALDEDPTLEKALRLLIAGRSSRGEWSAIEAVYLRLANHLAQLGDADRGWDTWRKLGVLRRDKLHNAEGAVEAFATAVRCRPENVDSRALLAEMYLATADEARAIAEFERIAQYAPTRASTYTRLFGLHRRAARTDQALLAAAALVELGTADMDTQLFVDQYRTDGPIRPTRSLDRSAWDELLRAPGADDVVADVLRAIVGSAVALRVEELRQARQLVSLDPARRQSATSTVSVVRSFHWAAQVLGLDPPELYVMDDVPGGIAAVQAPVPATALGPDVLRGMTTKELAFVAGRHLTYFRPEHYCLICYPTLSDLSALFLAAVTLVLPNLAAPAHLRDAVGRTRKVLAKVATDEERRRLEAAVGRLEARDGRVDLTAWIRSVELTAQRAGLLLCGDFAVAVARLRAEIDTRAIAELTFDEKRGDLLAFVASANLAQARVRLGVDARAVVGSTPPGQLQAG